MPPAQDDPYASKPLLWGKHCRGAGCDDFNEANPSCGCPCSACTRSRPELQAPRFKVGDRVTCRSGDGTVTEVWRALRAPVWMVAIDRDKGPTDGHHGHAGPEDEFTMREVRRSLDATEVVEYDPKVGDLVDVLTPHLWPGTKREWVARIEDVDRAQDVVALSYKDYPEIGQLWTATKNVRPARRRPDATKVEERHHPVTLHEVLSFLEVDDPSQWDEWPKRLSEEQRTALADMFRARIKATPLCNSTGCPGPSECLSCAWVESVNAEVERRLARGRSEATPHGIECPCGACAPQTRAIEDEKVFRAGFEAGFEAGDDPGADECQSEDEAWLEFVDARNAPTDEEQRSAAATPKGGT